MSVHKFIVPHGFVGLPFLGKMEGAEETGVLVPPSPSSDTLKPVLPKIRYFIFSTPCKSSVKWWWFMIMRMLLMDLFLIRFKMRF